MNLLLTSLPDWYDGPMFVAAASAIVSAVLTLIATQAGGIIERRRAARNRTRALRLAFLAEIEEIQRSLAVVLDSPHVSTDTGQVPYVRYFPKRVYEANVGNLGDLNDPATVKAIVALYSNLEVLEQMRADEPTEALRADYVSALAHTNLHACLARVSLPEPKDVDDDMIDCFNNAAQVMGKLTGQQTPAHMFRQGKKLLCKLHVENGTPKSEGQPKVKAA